MLFVNPVLVIGWVAHGLVFRRFFPGREYLCEDIEDNEGKDKKRERYKQTLHAADSYFIDSEPSETLGEQLSSDDHIPACGKDAELHKNGGYEIDKSPEFW